MYLCTDDWSWSDGSDFAYSNWDSYESVTLSSNENLGYVWFDPSQIPIKKLWHNAESNAKKFVCKKLNIIGVLLKDEINKEHCIKAKQDETLDTSNLPLIDIFLNPGRKSQREGIFEAKKKEIQNCQAQTKLKQSFFG